MIERDTSKKLAYENPVGPNVRRVRVALIYVQQYLWGCVAKGPTVSIGSIFGGYTFSKAEIYQFWVALWVNHHIFGFQVPVDDFILV